MRIPSGVTDQVIYFVAVDAADLKTRETGLTTFTVYRSRNGGAPVAMTTPTVTEVDAVNMPGVYKLLLDEDTTIGAGNDSEEMVLHITQAAMAPVTRAIEIYRRTVESGETIAATGGAVDNVVLVATTTANSDMRGTDGANTIAPDNAGIAAILVDTGTDIPAILATLATAAALASTDGKIDTIDTIVDAILLDTGTTLPATLATLATAAALATTDGKIDTIDALVDQLIAAVVTPAGEPGQGIPPVSAALADKIAYLFKAWRNKTEQTATELSLYADDGITVDHKTTVSDDGTTATKEEFVSGP